MTHIAEKSHLNDHMTYSNKDSHISITIFTWTA